MAEPVRPTGFDPVRDAAGVQPRSRPEQAPGEERPAFRALLDRLQEQASSLSERSKEVGDPAQLSDAVDEARASLDEALSLGERLLEAYREANHRTGADPSADEGVSP